MFGVTPVLGLPEGLSDLVRRLGVILAGLAAVVAARFVRMPAWAGLTVRVWQRLTHVAPRVGRVMLRGLAQGGAKRVRVSRAGQQRGVDAVARVRLPGGRGWLVRVLGYEAAGYRSQLEALLASPEMAAALEAMPEIGRVLRPICLMLGAPVALATAVAERPARPERPWPPAGKVAKPAERWPWEDFIKID